MNIGKWVYYAPVGDGTPCCVEPEQAIGLTEDTQITVGGGLMPTAGETLERILEAIAV